MNRRTVGVGVLVVALACAGTVWWLHSVRPVAVPVTAQEAVSTATPVSDPGDAQAATAALQQLETNPAALLPADLVGELGDTVAQAVPAGTHVSADPATWVPSSVGGGVIEARLDYPDGTTQRVGVVMVADPDGWKVLQTIPLASAP